MDTTVNQQRNSAVAGWVLEYGDELFSWAFFRTSDELAAQDIVQETFISALQHYDDFKETSSSKTWLFSILKNKIVDFYRRQAKSIGANPLQQEEDEISWFDEDERWKKEYLPRPWTADESLLDNAEFSGVLDACLKKLPTPWHACVQLKYLSEKESTEICQELSITPSNLWQILHRAKLQLRNCLERNWF